MTADGDGQNDPADMPRLIALAWGFPHHNNAAPNLLICGIRVNRQDTPAKRAASQFANAVRQAVLNDGCPDTGCALKLFRRELYLNLPFFNGLHRFMPALGAHYGAAVINTPVNDRPRRHGQSKSDFSSRALKGLIDLAGVAWLLRRSPKTPANNG
jgi:dolichol-phosphate mannosyltransferase